jgi:EAL domain-containing protein (putative c-di-GMP-specific phosphodiesterase class I)
LAINLSASQCREADFADRLLADIDRRGLHRSSVQVEVTEGVFLSASGEAVLDACRKLCDGGVRISFDDFGTGFASLTHLRDFPVDEIKIDRSFVADMSRPGNLAIVSAMVSLVNKLSMKVVAEGVETEEQAALLRSLGCHYAQGYLYSRPLPAAEAAKFVSRPLLELKACA